MASFNDDGVIVFDRAANGSLSFRQQFDDGDAITGGTVDSLDGAISVSISPDGQNVYVVSNLDNGVTVFDRAADGSLSLRQQFAEGSAITGGTVDSLLGARSVSVSPDGQNVYVVSNGDHAVTVFDRAGDGSLSLRQQFADGDVITGGTVVSLRGAVSVSISPDGNNVYVISVNDDGVTVFDRAADGSLSLRQHFANGDAITGGILDVLREAFSVSVSPDGKNVYVVSDLDDGVTVFDRAADGSLLLRQQFRDNDAITGGIVVELRGSRSVSISPDGKNVYVVSNSDNGVTVFDRFVDIPPPIPTLSQWGLIALGLFLLILGITGASNLKGFRVELRRDSLF